MGTAIATVSVVIAQSTSPTLIADDDTPAGLSCQCKGASFDNSPAITGLSPIAGKPGTAITITGTGLPVPTSGVPTVNFCDAACNSGGTPVPVNVQCDSTHVIGCITTFSATQIKLKAPVGVGGADVSVPGVTDILVVNPGVGGLVFSFGPWITSEQSLFAAPGANLTLKGVNLSAGAAAVILDPISGGSTTIFNQLCSSFLTTNCIKQTATSITLVPGPSLQGSWHIRVPVAGEVVLVPGGAGAAEALIMDAEANLPGGSGFFEWTTGPVVTKVA